MAIARFSSLLARLFLAGTGSQLAGKQQALQSFRLLAGDGQFAGTAGNQAAGIAGLPAGIAGTAGQAEGERLVLLGQAEGKRLGQAGTVRLGQAVALGSQSLVAGTAGQAEQELLAAWAAAWEAGTAAWEAAWEAAWAAAEEVA